MRYILLFFVALLFSACTQLRIIDYAEIQDLKELPQETGAYAYVKDDNTTIYDIQNSYEGNYFRPWNMQSIKTDADQIKWPFRSYMPSNSYGENLKPLSQDWFDKMYKRSNFSNYATVNLKAITLRASSLRSFPTDKPIFKDPNKAGEGLITCKTAQSMPMNRSLSPIIQMTVPGFISLPPMHQDGYTRMTYHTFLNEI